MLETIVWWKICYIHESIIIPNNVITGLGPSLFSVANGTPKYLHSSARAHNTLGIMMSLGDLLPQSHPSSGGQNWHPVCRCTIPMHQPLHWTASEQTGGQMGAWHQHILHPAISFPAKVCPGDGWGPSGMLPWYQFWLRGLLDQAAMWQVPPDPWICTAEYMPRLK